MCLFIFPFLLDFSEEVSDVRERSKSQEMRVKSQA